MVKPIEAGIADVVIGSRLLEDEAIAGGMPRWKWVGNRFLTAIENAAFQRGLLRVPHRLPGVLHRVPALDPVPAQLGRVRLRPGDLRPDGRAPGARHRAADPDPLLPRGVDRLVPRERRRTDCARCTCLPATGSTARDGRWPLLRRPAAQLRARRREPGRHAVTGRGGRAPGRPQGRRATRPFSWPARPSSSHWARPRSRSRRATSERPATASSRSRSHSSRPSGCSRTWGSSRSSCARSAGRRSVRTSSSAACSRCGSRSRSRSCRSPRSRASRFRTTARCGWRS